MLRGKTILITGGTSALGREVVLEAMRQGANVFFTYFKGSEEAARLQAAGAQGAPLDLGDSKAIESFAKALKDKTDGLDAVIYNAAKVADGRIEALGEEDWDAVMAVNVKGPQLLTKKLLRLLFKRKPSKIFTMTSRTAEHGAYGAANYAASKAALLAWTKSVAKELGKKNVLVNAINPGFMVSDMTRNLPEAVLSRHRALSPLGRISDPKEVAGFLVYLCSDKMTQVTGQTFQFESRSG